MTFIGVGFLLADLLPFPGPYSADVAAAYFHEDIDLKRFGIILMIVGGTMFMLFGAAIADRLRRVEGVGPIAAATQFGSAVIASTLMMLCGSMMLVGLLRPEMPDSSYQLLNHVTWLALGGLWQPGAVQAGCTAWAILSDKSSTPVFPRWVGWYSACMAFGSLTGSLIPFFTSGPFAWNGFISFWVAGAIFFAWYIIILVQFILAHRRSSAQEKQEAVLAREVASAQPDGVSEVSAR
ncbi:hypothetical protein ACQI4L_03235 [Mycolicibacterium litorale]|uniref:hypothetical protein n=1 Tax=Mycolicibacterium litorale TaxID=758802 RepID=UPI003CEBF68A